MEKEASLQLSWKDFPRLRGYLCYVLQPYLVTVFAPSFLNGKKMSWIGYRDYVENKLLQINR